MALPYEVLITPDQVVVASAGTRVPLSASLLASDNVAIQAHPDNAGHIYVGDSSVDSTHGWVLVPGQFITIEGSRRPSGSDSIDMSSIWVDAATDGDKVQWGYLKK